MFIGKPLRTQGYRTVSGLEFRSLRTVLSVTTIPSHILSNNSGHFSVIQVTSFRNLAFMCTVCNDILLSGSSDDVLKEKC